MLSQTPRSPAVKYPLGQLIGSAVHLPCETHNLEAPRRSHTHASASSVHALRPLPSEQSPVRPVSRRLTVAAAAAAVAAPPLHRAATSSSPPSDCCSCAAIRTTSPAAFAGPWQPDQAFDHSPANWALSSRGSPGCRSGRVFAATTSGHATWHNIRPSRAATTVASPQMVRAPLLLPSAMPLSPTSLAGRRHQEGVRR